MTDILLPELFKKLPDNASPLDKSPVLAVLEATQSYRSSEAVQAIVSLATMWPFNPNDTIRGVPLLISVINDPHRSHYNDARWRRLPRNLADPGVVGTDEEGNPAFLDNEWLAGILLAAGADPWTRHKIYGGADAPALDALELCLTKGMPSLVEALLDHPGAPDAAELAARTALNVMGDIAPGVSWWAHLCAADGNADTLKVLARRGADPHQTAADGTHPLEDAQRDTAELYAVNKWLPTDENVLARIRKAWKDRAKRGVLRMEDFNTMSGYMESQAGALQAKTQATVEKLVTLPWGSGMSRVRDMVDAENVAEKIHVARGAYRGTWSGLSAAAFASIRVGSSFTSLSWDSSGPMGGTWKPGGYDSPQWSQGAAGRRLLQEGMAFEWREGIPAKAIVMMALLRSSSATSKVEFETEMASDLGIEHFARELQDTLPGMAAFTRAVAGRNGSANGILAQKWTLIEQFLGAPDSWAKNGWQLAEQVVGCLLGDAHNDSHYLAHKLAEHLSFLKPPGTSEPEEQVAHGLICLRTLLATTSEKTTERSEAHAKLLMAHPVLATPTLKDAWFKQALPLLDTSNPRRGPALDALLEHIKLDGHLDKVASSNKSRMRL